MSNDVTAEDYCGDCGHLWFVCACGVRAKQESSAIRGGGRMNEDQWGEICEDCGNQRRDCSCAHQEYCTDCGEVLGWCDCAEKPGMDP
jgi:hypothetical protein